MGLSACPGLNVTSTGAGVGPGGNPYAFAIRDVGRLPEAPWAQGNGFMRTELTPTINTPPSEPVPQYTFTHWQPTRQAQFPRPWSPHLGARASLTGWGFPSTWFTLRLPLAQPDLQTALSRRLRPILQKYAAAGNAGYRIPAAFVPIRPTGPG